MNKQKFLLFILGYCIFCSVSFSSYAGNVFLKSVIVNPSKTKTQKARIKAFLPKEATPDDVVDLGDLKIDYDIDKELYYVYKEVTLKPGESLKRQVEIKDIWMISDIELEELINKGKDGLDKLKKTIYYESAADFLKDMEVKKLDILDTQNKAVNSLPQKHISVYRKNIERLSKVKELLENLEKMVIKTEISGGLETKRVFVKASWKVILAVVFALGFVSFVFFIVWHKQTEEKVVPPREDGDD